MDWGEYLIRRVAAIKAKEKVLIQAKISDGLVWPMVFLHILTEREKENKVFAEYAESALESLKGVINDLKEL